MAFAYIPRAVRADEPGLPPMGSLAAVAYFAIPSAVLVLSVHVLLPMLSGAGASGFTNLFLCLGAPLAGLLVASLVGYRKEGHEWSWTSFRNRFRLHAPGPATLVWTVALATWVMFFAPRLLGFTVPWIIGALPPQPAVVGLFDIQPGQFLGVPLEGNPWPILGFVLYLSVNVVGEELWWRGYVLPRQELALCASAWFVHGLLWTAFHVFFYWQLLMILPITLAISFVSQRTKSTWPAIVGHALLNWGTFPFLVHGFLGQ